MRTFLEKLSVLALSSMLVSAFSVSSALPLMLEHFQSYPVERVELLVSTPSFFVLLVLLLNRPLNRFFTERQMIVTGLLLMSSGGILPILAQEYWLVFLSRMCFGFGVGMINAKAISMISERYEGTERIQMLGYRASSEVVGSAFLTMLVGHLIQIQWNYAFAIYSFGLVILLLYLFFVPKRSEQVVEQTVSRASLSLPLRLRAMELALFAGWNVCISSCISLRVPVIVTEGGLGTASSASLILSLYQLVGIGSGLAFAPLLRKCGSHLLALSYLALALSTLGLALSSQFVILSIAALGAGFVNSVLMTAVFHELAEEMPAPLLNNATAIVLVGCNLGGFSSPYVLKGIGLLGESYSFIFSLFAASCVGFALLAFLTLNRRTSDALG
ncbi:MFS transporter [Streptococcus cuniculi]|uniref:MFS transporter n=1 Tax=Streptococcus cuniculi TaxID=1432788 RepID=A0A4Y9JBW8_9STRE|nr:MFS transporter [Streptococcus cuniculi]MBF0778385.1 MFS transporter [Streptococcus cuniculi]TFU97668.1 MFS transporter [Streptococcus cuniculi]